ncbi:MAG: 2-oxo acid dehydrogenase subunit E2 [Burkholderiaceae bacterium]|nr:2-oxo acid dehydrogenase subunit E2 [Burkholderiaceae bacterium]
MEIDILMPSIGAGTTQGKILQWHVKPGDNITAGDLLAEIETDKAVIELEAIDDGILSRIIVDAGDLDVPVASVIAKLEQEGESPKEKDVPAQDTAKNPPKSIPTVSSRVFSSPAARNIARNFGIDIADVPGSGPNGRIVKFDVQTYVATKAPLDVPKERPQPVAASQATDANSTPHSNIRKTIAKRLTESKREAPHFYLTVSCQMDGLLKLRSELNDRSAIKFSINDLLLYVISRAFKRHPKINTIWTDDALIQRQGFDINVAVSTEAGLITPVLKDSDKKSLGEIAAETRELIGLAKEGKLKPDQYEGGGLTVSNLGMYGISNFYAIINPPQAAILAVSAVEKKPIVVDDQIVIGQLINISLSADHRTIDGAVGALFLNQIKSLIENPIELII